MTEAGSVVRERFEMGALNTGLAAFYVRLGWEIWLGPSYVRDGAELRRTAEEDGGILVLRFGPSAGFDLSLPISCEARSGDDW
jgi:aminoglycoside 2'-N-acetyltransferase I